MARIRSVHPNICLSETMAQLSAEVERCFVRLWTHCDDEGRCEDRPKVIAAQIFAANEEIMSKHVDEWLNKLQEVGCIQRYEVDGRKYLQVVEWDTYQHPQKPKKSVIPAPPPYLSGRSTVQLPEGYAVGVGEGEGVGEGVRTVVEQSSTSLELFNEVPTVDSHPITEVFETWQDVTGHPKAKLSTERRRVIEKALKMYPLDEVLEAVRGVTCSDFHMGDNDNRVRYDDLTLILRNATKIEFFRDLYRNGPVRVQPKGAAAIERFAKGDI